MHGRTLPQPADHLRRFAPAAPALLMVAVFVVLGAAQGGYFETAFLPATLFALALLAVTLVSVATSARVPRTVWAALALFGAYAAWSYLSILWAPNQGSAWEGANRALMYAIVFAIFALWPLRSAAAAAVLAAFGLGVAALGIVTLLRVGAASDVSTFFVSGRFADPLGYTNGNVALWFSGLLPCVFTAARREVPAPVRGLALGGAGLLAGLSLLGQSRGWLVVLPLILLALIAVVPGRARMAVVLVAVAVAVLAVLRPVLAVFQGFSDGLDLAPLASAAATSILIMAAALALVGLLAALADRRVELSPPAARRTRRGTALVAAVAIVAAATIGAVSLGDPVGAGSDALAEFTSGGDGGQPRGSSRFTSASGQNRFDFWEVGLSEFADAPVIGAGTGSFQTAYVREGETSQRPRFAHSLEVRLLFETGIVGALLFAGAVALALFAGARAVRRSSPLGAGAAGTAIVVFLYWVAHGSVDWFYELPALAAPAFAMLGLATAAAPRAERAGARPLAAGRARAAALAVAAVAMAAAIGAPWLAQRHTEAAIATWQVDAPGAFERLRSAATLNPLSSEPHGAAAAIALRLGNLEVARVEFEELLERDPGNAYAAVQLAALASERGERDEAVELLRRAAAIAPRDTLVEDALERIEVGERLDANAIYDAALERRSALTAGPPSQDGP